MGLQMLHLPHTYIQLYTHTQHCTYTPLHTYTHTQHTPLHTHMHTFTHTPLHTHTYIPLHTHSEYTCKHTHIYTFTHTHTHNTPTSTYTNNTHIHRHTLPPLGHFFLSIADDHKLCSLIRKAKKVSGQLLAGDLIFREYLSGNLATKSP